MRSSWVLPWIYFLFLKPVRVAPPTWGHDSLILQMPQPSLQCVTHSVSDFCDTVASDSCRQGNASVSSLQLRKFASVTTLRHEFLILSVSYGEEDYFIHLNRAWAGMGWWGDFEYLTKGMNLADIVAIHLPGEEEARARDNSELIAQIDFNSSTVVLRDVADCLHSAVTAGPYTFSRVLTLDIMRKWNLFIQDVKMPKEGGQVDVVALLKELAGK